MAARHVLAASLVTVLLAGCAGAPSADELVGDPSAPGPADGGMAAGNGTAEAPAWEVGQWWDHHWYFGPQDTTGFVVKAIVVETTSAGYRLATDEDVDAASHAAFYFHDQGVMSPQDWTVRDFGGSFQFPWYSFPLADGKTWRAQEENLDFSLERVSRQLTMTATAMAGKPGAFLIEARDPDGGLRARWDYRPDLEWFGEYRSYPTGNQDPEAYNIRMVNENQGRKWAGTYFLAQADFLLSVYGEFSPSVPGPPPPPASFAISEQHTHALAVLFSYAVGGGAAYGQLVAPDGQHWETYASTFPNGSPGPVQSQPFVYVPAVPGEWRYALAAGDAAYAGGGCWAFGVTVANAVLA